MCMGGRSSPPPTHRQYDSSKYYNGNIYDPKPEPKPVVSNQNNNDSGNDSRSGGGTIVQSSGLTIVDDEFNSNTGLTIS